MLLRPYFSLIKLKTVSNYLRIPPLKTSEGVIPDRVGVSSLITEGLTQSQSRTLMNMHLSTWRGRGISICAGGEGEQAGTYLMTGVWRQWRRQYSLTPWKPRNSSWVTHRAHPEQTIPQKTNPRSIKRYPGAIALQQCFKTSGQVEANKSTLTERLLDEFSFIKMFSTLVQKHAYTSLWIRIIFSPNVKEHC